MLGVTICTKCNGEKEDTGTSWCPSCQREAKRTKDGVVTRIYAGQKASSKLRGHRPPEYSKVELKEWLFSQTLFHELHAEWVQSGYKKRLKPSVDRKCDEVHYCMRNIQLMTWEENNLKGLRDQGIAPKAIEVFLHKQSVGVFDSIRQADRELDGISYGSLHNSLRDGSSSKGYTVERI